MKSLWSDKNELPGFPELEGAISADVLIIGGGMAGILTAYILKEAGVRAVLLEGERICSGVTKNTTAKITSQHGLIYADLVKRFGVEKASMYLRANEAAVRKYFEIGEKVGCPIERKTNYIYSRTDTVRLLDEVNALKKIGYTALAVKEVELPFAVSGAVGFRDQGQFDPLEFASKIAPGLEIYENSFVKKLRGQTAYTDKGCVSAKAVIIATHFPFINRHGSYFLKMYQERSYVAAYTGAGDLDGMYLDADNDGFSFRNHGEYLLIGGGNHRTGKEGDAWKGIEKTAGRYFRMANLKYRWATEDCMTLDKVPYIGRYSALTDRTYVATGFNKWGMTSSMVAAGILTDMITGKKNDCARVFSPSRSIMRPQLAVNAFEALTGIVNFKTRRCPHLGCALEYNRAEHTWDCPCHGSRFTVSGRLIDNPAMKGLNVRANNR